MNEILIYLGGVVTFPALVWLWVGCEQYQENKQRSKTLKMRHKDLEETLKQLGIRVHE